MIPFDENYQQVAEIVSSNYGVEIYPDLEFVDNLCHRLYNITFLVKAFLRLLTNKKNKLVGSDRSMSFYILMLILLFLKKLLII